MRIYSFLFDLPPSLTRADMALFVFFGAVLLFAIASYLLSRTVKNNVSARLARRLSGGGFGFAVVGAIWAGIRYLSIPYLGTRFVASLILFSGLVWLGFVLKYVIFKYGVQMRQWEHEQVKSRYLKNSR
ncbi:MAG: hypothetical protein Q8N81_04765 [bacterium]|nr:hypothetical protein [bacterium]